MMETIRILLVRIDLGPFSERQVREYLADGLLLPSDPARHEMEKDWQPLSLLLANLPQPFVIAPPVAGDPPSPDTLPSTTVLVEPGPTPSLPVIIPSLAPEVPESSVKFSARIAAFDETLLKNFMTEASTTAEKIEPLEIEASYVPQIPLEKSKPDDKGKPWNLPAKPQNKDVHLAALPKPVAWTSKLAVPPEKPSEKQAKHADKLAQPLELPATHAEKVILPLDQPLSSKKPEVKKRPVKPVEIITRPEIAVEKVGEEPKKTTPPVSDRPRSKIPRLIILIGLAVLTALAPGIFYYRYIHSSYQTADSLRLALKDGDRAQMEQIIDFPSVRKSLKGEVEIQLGQSKNADAGNHAAVLEMMKNSIDLYVNPEAIAALTSHAGQFAPKSPGPVITPTLASSILSGMSKLPVKNEGLLSWNQFVVDLEAIQLDLHFDGWQWKVKRIHLKPGFNLPATADLPQKTPPSQSPLVAPAIQSFMANGEAALQRHDWDAAITAYTQVLGIDPKKTDAYTHRGLARLTKGDLDSALADFTQALQLAPESAQIYVNRGDTKSAKVDLDGAIADYTQAIKLDPNLATTLNSKIAGLLAIQAEAKTMKKDLDGAIADYTQAIQLDPNLKLIHERGTLRTQKGDFKGAIADFTKVLALDPKDASALNDRGFARQATGDWDGAISDCTQALSLDPKIAAAYFNRALARQGKKDLDGAMDDYTQALTLNPKMPLAHYNRGRIKQTKRDLVGAIADYNQALAIDPKNVNALYNRGMLKEELGDLDGAITDSTQILDLDPEMTQVYYNRGIARLLKNNLEGARSDLKKYCDIAKRDAYTDNAHVYLWLIDKTQDPNGPANQDLTEAIQHNWKAGDLSLISKIARFLLDRITESDLIAAAASTDPTRNESQYCEVWYFAGMKRLLAGDKSTAIDYFNRCLDTGKKDYCEYLLSEAQLKVVDPK